MYYLNILPGLLGWSLLALVILAIWSIIIRKVPALHKYALKISPLNVFMVLILTVVTSMLFNAIWSDITRAYLGQELQRYYDITKYGVGLLAMHAIYAVPLFFFAVIAYQWSKRKNPKTYILVLPYLISSLLIFMRVLGESGRYVIYRFERLGIYAVLIFFLVVVSLLAIYVQNKWEKSHSKSNPSEPKMMPPANNQS